MDNGNFGIEAVRSYANFRAFFGRTEADTPDLHYTFNISNGLYHSLSGAGYPCNFYWADGDSWAVDFEPASAGGLADSMADNVDLFYWSGHSYLGIPEWAEVVFDSQINWWSSPSTKWDLGINDLEWLALYSCDSVKLDNFPDTGWRRYNNLFDGLHLMLGSYDTMHVGSSYADIGRNFAENLIDGDTLVAAWFNATGKGNAPAVLSAELGETFNTPDWNNTTMATDHYWGRGLVKDDIPRSRLGWIGVWWI
jgi:hypothetical protein